MIIIMKASETFPLDVIYDYDFIYITELVCVCVRVRAFGEQ